jgi:hypothetical protein
MNSLLNEALAQLNLQPSETYRTTVYGHEVEVRALKAAPAAEPPEDSAPPSNWEMLDLWLDIPPSETARSITVQQGEPLLPAPFHLDESDLAPERITTCQLRTKCPIRGSWPTPFDALA